MFHFRTLRKKQVLDVFKGNRSELLVENGSILQTLKVVKLQCGGIGDRNGELATHFKVCAKKTKSKRMESSSSSIL